MCFGSFRILRRHVVVHDEDHFIFIGNLRILQLVVIHIHSQMCGSVIAHHAVQSDRVNIIWLHLVHAGGSGNDLFS